MPLPSKTKLKERFICYGGWEGDKETHRQKICAIFVCRIVPLIFNGCVCPSPLELLAEQVPVHPCALMRMGGGGGGADEADAHEPIVTGPEFSHQPLPYLAYLRKQRVLVSTYQPSLQTVVATVAG